MKILMLLIMGLLFNTQGVLANDAVTADILTRDIFSWDGSNIQYPKGIAEITVTKFTVPRGVIISDHCHPIPVAAYVMTGAIEVTKPSGEKKIFRQGDAYIGMMNKWHGGRGVGEDTQVIIFHAGQLSLSDYVDKNGDSALASKCN